MNRALLGPGKQMENTLRIINQAMNYSGSKYWLCFGGLWGLIQNNGVIPDGDFDLCTYYGEDYERIAKAFEGSPGQYKMSKALISDTEGKALYCSFGSTAGYPHICLSFWYLHKGIRYYCHDQHHEVEGVGVPKSGYFFRGVPAYSVDPEEDNFRMVEWPGVHQTAKIRVPRQSGVILDHLYPDWAYRTQKYEVKTGTVDESRMASYHKGGAISPYAVHKMSMRDWENELHTKDELSKSLNAWKIRLKNGK
jgi:hypothetical protein